MTEPHDSPRSNHFRTYPEADRPTPPVQPLRHWRMGLVAALATSLFTSCSTTEETLPPPPSVAAAPSQEAPSIDPGRPIRPGEVIDVYVLEDESFNGRYLVRAGGDVILPKIGRVQLAGKSLTAAENSIRSQLSIDQLREANVIVDRSTVPREQEVARQNVQIYITGKVAKPGRVAVPFIEGQPATAYQAVSGAGGFLKFANKKRSYLLRKDASGKPKRYALDLDAIEQGRAADIPIQSGDTIVVPEKKIGF